MNTYKNKQRFEDALIRKRDLEFRKQEETKARERYYTKFDQVNAKFQNWTGPEYYEQCAQQIHSSKAKKEKEQKLQERRERLQKMLEQENHSLQEERRILEQSRRTISKHKEIPEDVVAEIYKQLKLDTEERRRKEIEERLYQHWRKTEGCRILEAPEFNEHQALAKISWMDKQVTKHMDRENQTNKELTKTKISIDQLKTELNSLHDQQKDLKQICHELKLSIEHEVKEYKQIDEQNSLLKAEENNLKITKDSFINVFDEYSERSKSDINRKYMLDNIKFHKMNLKQYSNSVIQDLNYKIDILQRLRTMNVWCQKSKALLDSVLSVLIQQNKLEVKRKVDMEAMYDSEAKYTWSDYILKWKNEERDRTNLFSEILDTLNKQIEIQVQTNMKYQRQNIISKEKLLKSIEDQNYKISLTENDIKFNNDRITYINSELLKLECQNEQLHTYLSEIKDIPNSSDLQRKSHDLSPMPSTKRSLSHQLLSPRYQDSVKELLYNCYSPQSVFGCNVQNY